MKYRIIIIFSAIIFATADMTAQTGGNFAITQSVVAGSGGQNSAVETYIISIFSGRFTFSQPTQVVAVLDTASDINFIADEL